MSAEYWHEPCMFDLLQGIPASERKYTKYDTMNWLGYNRVRRAIEKKRSEEVNKNNQGR